MKRYYEILGVGRDTPLDQVRQAYRDLVRVWHPDRFSTDYRLARISEEKLKLINEAYREIRAQIERNPHPEQGVLFTGQGPAKPPASPGDGEYMFEFYDPDYSPWIWTYQRERGSPPAASTVRNRPRRVALLAAAICLLGLSGAAAARHFGLIPSIPGIGDSLPGPAIRDGRSRVVLVNDTGDDAVVKLVLAGTGGSRVVRSVFLPAGKSFTATEIPSGRYLVKAALGTGWDARAMRFRRPAGFAGASGVELEEEAADRAQADGIVVRRIVASELRVPLDRLKGTPITEEEFRAD